MPRLPARAPATRSVRAPGRTVVPDGGPRDRRRTPGVRWRLLLWRVRFPVAAAFLALATTLVVAELRPAPAVTVPVTVAGRELAPGVPLTAADLQVVRMPTALLPAGAHPSVDAVVGQRLVVGAPTGLPIVDALLAGDRLATAGPVGTVVAPIRLADPAVAALLRPGDRIDLLAAAGTADGEPAVRQLATRAIVLADPDADPVSAPGVSAGQDAGAGAFGGLLGGGSTDPGTGALTLVAVTPAEAAALAGAVGWANLSAVVVQ